MDDNVHPFLRKRNRNGCTDPAARASDQCPASENPKVHVDLFLTQPETVA
jgi:hypothetical protein